MASEDYHNYSDPVLLTAWKQGDERAFDTLYRRYAFFLVNQAAPKIRDAEAAKDIVQEVMLRLYHQRDHLDVSFSLKGYLEKATRNQVYNYKRDQLKLRFENIDGMEVTDSTPTTVETLSLRDTQRRISVAVSTLPEQCRRVFLLSREEQFSNREIAEHLGISVKTVEQHMTKALKILREKLDYHLFVIVMVGSYFAY